MKINEPKKNEFGHELPTVVRKKEKDVLKAVPKFTSVKHNRAALVTLSSCSTCIARDNCREYAENGVRENGHGGKKEWYCPAVKQAYVTAIRDLGSPQTYMMKKLAELETKMSLKELQDGGKKEISKEYLQLVDYRLRYYESLMKTNIMGQSGLLKTRVNELDSADDVVIDLEGVNLDDGVED